MSTNNNFERLNIIVPTEPGIYKTLFPDTNPSGHLVIWVGPSNNCMSFIPFPITVFEDSMQAFEDEPTTESKSEIQIPGETTNVYVFQPAARISKNSA